MRVDRSASVFRNTVSAAAVLVCLTTPATASAQATAGDPAAILAAAREAIGGEKRLADVKTLVATGRTRQVRGDNLVPIEFEISSEFPDKYIRRDEVPAQENGPTTSGFNGNALIQIPPAPTPPARAGGPPPPTPAQLEAGRSARAGALKQDFARLMLGLFAGSFSSFPLTFTYVGTAEAPQGEADVLDVKGPANFVARFFIYKSTHLPVMLSWQAAAPGGPARGIPGRGAPPPSVPAPGTPPPGPPPTAAQGTPPPESRLYFADYRDVDGLKLPFRIRRAVGPDTVEETTFDRFRLNAKIDPKKFEVK
jgi:hypothetical protein